MKKITLLLILFVFSSVLLAQSINKNGWNNLKWGASVSDVKGRYNITDYDSINRWCSINNMPIAGKTFKVIFHFDSDHKLSSVVLARYNFYADNIKKFRFEEEEMGKLQNEIESALISKYGKPSFKNDSPEYKVIWSFPGLKIEASSSVNYRPKLTDNSQVDYSEQKDDLAFSDNFSITYSKPNKTDTSGL
jgi:hypothetical protein